MSWSLFRITSVDIKPAVVELRRIADSLEAYMSHVHNYNVTTPKPIATGGRESPSVAYASDESTALRELREEYERSEGKPVDDEEEDNT